MAGRTNNLKRAAEGAILLAADIAALFIVFKLAVLLREDFLPLVYAGFPEVLGFKYFRNSWWILLVWVFFFYYEGLYDKRYLRWDEIRALWKSSFFATVGVFTIVSVGKLSEEISRTVVVLMGVLALFVLPSVRAILKRSLRRAGLLKRKVLILGAGKTGELIARALRKEQNLGYDVVGFIDDEPAKVGVPLDGIPVYGDVERTEQYMSEKGATDLVIAMPGAGHERIRHLININQHKADRILVVPDLLGMAVMGTSLQQFFEEQAIALELKNNLAEPINYATKRAFDYIVGTFFLILLALPFVVISVAIRLGSTGPALFRQERIGIDGKHFICYKFRTMYEDAEERLEAILRDDPDARAEWEEHWKLKSDPRITPFGRLLRRLSLDELPQIFNVLKGEMSLVGPRPYMTREKEFLKEPGVILSVLPGITGLWQVSGRSSVGFEYRMAHDRWYVRNWNLWLDIVILLKTVGAVLRREGAW